MNACRSRLVHQLTDRQANRMRQIFERIDVDIVGAAGQEGAERCAVVFVDNGAASAFDRPCWRRIARTAARAKAIITAPSA